MFGGSDIGLSPKPLVLVALAGCTGIDVVAILKKSGILLKTFRIKVVGELSKQKPDQYRTAVIEYEAEAEKEIKDGLIHAVNRSQNELCGVGSMLRSSVAISWRIFFNGKEIFNNEK